MAVPTVLNTASFTIMQFADGLMVSRLGPQALSAQFIGGITAFTPVCFFIGLLSCVSTFASQNLGAGRPERAARYGWNGVWIAWAAAAGLALLILPAPYLLALYGHDAELVAMETAYFRILIGGVIFNLTARALASWFVGIHRPGVTLAAGVLANVVNLVANYALIFGRWGFPALGLAGAGLGTVMGTVVEAAVLAAVFLAGPIARRYDVRRQMGAAWSAVKDLLRVGSPAGAMFVGDVLMWAIFMGAIIGHFGTKHLAAAAVLNRYWHLCFMPALGVSAAVTAIVGRYCGAGLHRVAFRRAHAGLILVEAYMVTMGVVIWFGRDFFVGIFNGTRFDWDWGTWTLHMDVAARDPEVQAIATAAVIFILICQAFDALNIIFIGALRGAGDTLVPGIVQLALAYGLGLGGSALIAWAAPQWGSLGPWGTASGYVIVLGLFMWARFLGGRWRRIRLVEPAPAPAQEEPAALPPV